MNMELINEKVKHCKFGEGTVNLVENGHIVIKFECSSEEAQQKMFPYPAAFEKYLKMSDPRVQSFVDVELKKFQDELIAQRIIKEKERQDEAERQSAEKLTLRKVAPKKAKTAKAKITKTKEKQED